MSEAVQSFDPVENLNINFTDAAALKVKELIEEEREAITDEEKKKNFNLYLRVYITGGGCSGFQYGFTFDENKNDDDMEIDNHGVTLLVDSMSFQYLIGADVDYKEDVEGAHFVIRNPNAKTTCGCGSSFSV